MLPSRLKMYLFAIPGVSAASSSRHWHYGPLLSLSSWLPGTTRLLLRVWSRCAAFIAVLCCGVFAGFLGVSQSKRSLFCAGSASVIEHGVILTGAVAPSKNKILV